MKITIDPELKALIPALAPEELAQLEANALGFHGYHKSGDSLTLTPTPMGCAYWLWSRCTLSEGGYETYSKSPTAISRLPVKEWKGFELNPIPTTPRWNLDRETKNRSTELTNVYFIQSVLGGPVKIGRAANPEQRLKQHQTGSPFELRIIRTINNVPNDYEKQLHDKFRAYRLHGEWFSEKVLSL